MESHSSHALVARVSRSVIVWTVVIVGAIASCLCYSMLPFPYAAIGIIGLIGGIVLTVQVKSKAWKLICVYFAWASVMIVLAESWFWIRDSDKLSVKIEGGFSDSDLVFDSDLGCVPASNRVIRARKTIGSETIYDVEYQIGENSLRAYPERNGNESVLFFGGSMMFGEGLTSEETVAFHVSEAFGMEVYNFGFPGYGPHQVLRSIENGRVQSIVETPPRLAVFLSFSHHILRMAGRAAWDPVGPKYLLNAKGEVVHRGSFSPSQLVASMRIALHKAQRKSTVYRALFEGKKWIRDEEIELYGRVTRKMQDLLEKAYPGISFKVIVFDFDDRIHPDGDVVEKMIGAMTNQGVHAVSTRVAFSRYDEIPDEYHLSEYDSHPSALANRELAEYIVKISQ